MKKKKVIVFTTGRADFYLLSLLVEKLNNSNKFKSFLAATGNHFDKKKGNTFKEISKSFKIDYKIPFKDKKGDKINIINQISAAFKIISKIFSKIKPDAIIVLGDRFELIPITYNALILNIPIVHLQGGEITEGAIDDSIRHSVTKISNIHFVCNKIYRQRIINMGEDPKNVYNVGGIGAELISKQSLFSKKELEKILKLKLDKDVITVSLHPETNTKNVNYKSVFNVIDKLKKKYIFIFTSPNSDPGYHEIQSQINKIKNNKDCHYFYNLGSKKYYSLIKISKLLIGNSSSGILEAPVLNIPSINIGDRQKGRLLENSVLNSEFNEKKILVTIKKALKRKNKILKLKYYKNQKASEKMINILSNIKFNKITTKKFYEKR